MSRGKYVDEYDYEGKKSEALDFVCDMVEELIERRLGTSDIKGRMVSTEDDKPLVHIDIDIYC